MKECFLFLETYPCVLYYLIGINVLTFFMFFFDKRRAITGKRRIRERTLLLFSGAGGAAFGFLAMQIFRHKTRKAVFFMGLPLMILMHLGAFCFFMTNI